MRWPKIEDVISRNIEKMQEELGSEYFRLSASGLAFSKVFPILLEEYGGGRLLDAGAENLLYEDLLGDYRDSYEALMYGMLKVSSTFRISRTEILNPVPTTRLCRNVLEHVEKPRSAMSEISKLLRDDGTAIISVPHLAFLHSEPEGYYGFTQYGLEEIASDTELEASEIRLVGGFL